MSDRVPSPRSLLRPPPNTLAPLAPKLVWGSLGNRLAGNEITPAADRLPFRHSLGMDQDLVDFKLIGSSRNDDGL